MQSTIESPPWRRLVYALLVAAAVSCRDEPPADRVRVSGQVEATDVQVAAQVGGRLLELGRRRRRSRRGRRGRRPSRTPTRSWRWPAHGRSAIRPTRSCGCCRPGRGPRTSARPRRRSPRRRPTRARPRPRSPPPKPTSSASRRCSPRTPGSRKQRDDAVARRDVARARAVGGRRPRPRGAREPGAAARRRAAARRSTPPARASPPPTRRSPRWQKAIADATVTAPDRGNRHREARRGRRARSAPRADRRHHRSRSCRGRTSTSTSRSCRACGSARRRRCSPTPAAQASRAPISYISPSRRVHAAQRADGRGSLEARLPRQGHGRQQGRHAQGRACRSKRRSRLSMTP